MTPPVSIAGGRYTLRALLGEGATKRVYLGRDLRLDREVAIVRVDTAGLDDQGRLRVEREAQAMARLGDHPNIVAVDDLLEEDGALYIVTQYLAGGDLGRRIGDAPGGRLAIEDAVAIAIQICRALEHAHGRGVVHRDLEPANVWIGADGTAKLGDFGLALAIDNSRLTVEGMIVGTVAYMAPEQVLGRAPDARSDLYAMGATLYEMVTGLPPFAGDDAVAILSQHLHVAPVAPSWHNPELPAALDRLILDLLAKDPEARPASAALVRGRLVAVTSTPVAAPVGAGGQVPNPLDRLASGVFVGRAEEIALLRRLFEDSVSGRFRLALYAGEPGMGKTRAVEELVTYARLRGAEILWGRCHGDGGAPAFWPWVQVVRAWMMDREPREMLAALGSGASDLAQVVPELHDVLPGLTPPPRLDAEQARFRFFESVVGMLRTSAQRRPLVVVLDDLHWADEASLHLLQFVTREPAPPRLLVVGTYRDVELRRGQPLAETLGELARLATVERVLLCGLDIEAVESFLRQTAGVEPPRSLVEAVHRETEGNPFFLHEVVRLLAAEGRLDRMRGAEPWSLAVPQGGREVIGRRLNRLSAACNETLAVASVLGRELDVATLSRVSGRDQGELLSSLEEALGARVLAVAPGLGRYRFAHALVRETLYEELTPPRRAMLHRACAEALEERHGDGDGPHLAPIAHHRFEAAAGGDVDLAIDACERAARWSDATRAWEEAALYLSRAVELLDLQARPSPLRLCELVVSLAEALALGRNVENTRATALRGAELARQTGSAVHLGRAALAYGASMPVVEMGRVDPTRTHLLEEAIAALGDLEPALRARLMLQLAQELLFESDFARMDALTTAAGRIATEIGDLELQGEVLSTEGFSSRAGGERAVLERSSEMVELARRSGNLLAEFRGWVGAVLGATMLGDGAAARRALAEERTIADQLRLPFPRLLARYHEGMFALLEGRFSVATEILGTIGEEARGMSGAGNARQWIGALFFVLGRHRGDALPLGPTRDLVERHPQYPVYRAFLCAVYLSHGETNEARRELGLLAAGLGEVPRDSNWLPTMVLAADAAADLDETRAATLLHDLLGPSAGLWSGIGPMVACLGPVDLRLGRLAALLGRDRGAARHLARAAEHAGEMGARPWLAEARFALAKLLARAGAEGARGGALTEVDAAIGIGREIGMAKLVEDALAWKLEMQGVAGTGGEGHSLPFGAPSDVR